MAAPAGVLPGIDQAQEYLGLTLKEIASAVRADESTLHRWKGGVMPTAVFLGRLEALDELVAEMRSTFRREAQARAWLDRPLPGQRGSTPRDLILAGRAEILTGMLYALNSGMSL